MYVEFREGQDHQSDCAWQKLGLNRWSDSLFAFDIYYSCITIIWIGVLGEGGMKVEYLNAARGVRWPWCRGSQNYHLPLVFIRLVSQSLLLTCLLEHGDKGKSQDAIFIIESKERCFESNRGGTLKNCSCWRLLPGHNKHNPDSPS